MEDLNKKQTKDARTANVKVAEAESAKKKADEAAKTIAAST